MGAGVVKKSSGGGRGRRRRGSSAAMADINITPFVDVMLVLLIIFMVTAPMLTVGVPLELPKTAAATLPSTEEPLTVSLTADGLVMIQTLEVPEADLIPKLKAIAAERSDNKVYLRADGTLPYTRVAEVMGALSAGGFTNIGLVTDAGGPKMDGN
jgi:biopolymer transport protein TolR